MVGIFLAGVGSSFVFQIQSMALYDASLRNAAAIFSTVTGVAQQERQSYPPALDDRVFHTK